MHSGSGPVREDEEMASVGGHAEQCRHHARVIHREAELFWGGHGTAILAERERWEDGFAAVGLFARVYREACELRTKRVLVLYPCGLVGHREKRSSREVTRKRTLNSMPGKKILIVEDDSMQLTMTAKRLKSAGYTVIGARDGISAISTARKEQPDLVLLDLGLPGGDGFVVIQRLQTLLPTTTIPIVVITSRPPSESEEAAKRAGAVAYMQKPVNFEKLLQLVADVIGTPELSS